MSHAGYALPGIVIGLSLVFVVSRFARPLYQSLAVLILAYVVRFLPQALAALRTALAAVGPRFEEAARSLGGSESRILRTLVLPLIRPGVAAGFGLVFLTAIGAITYLLTLVLAGFKERREILEMVGETLTPYTRAIRNRVLRAPGSASILAGLRGLYRKKEDVG